eukprot:gnl/MRDRNA2_/MRDRNA2_87595_c0_seq1.p1 gnl/MRDRNA2_/MRDRNA2_87595_c0~~gnl/MRDRNA2_/MRDRNA2_87595_c0_seq1.p1  ORF type:complete len:256 (-),score=89.36 gnl/MRDRNA2_/MRDRNA2_87595_c0_seq1:31-798(-)
MAAPDAAPVEAAMHQTNLTGAKEARKRAELDAQLLANRIALLKQEEEKAWNKINETRRRAHEIVQRRQQNEGKYLAKEQFYKEKWESIRTAQAENSANRERSKEARTQTRSLLLNEKKNNVHATKMQSQDHLAQKKEREFSEKQSNADRSQFIKQQKLEARRKLEMERKAKLDMFHDDYEARTAEEEQLRERTQALVAQMEKEEMELIQRLQNTQTVQRNAYEELENALGQTSQQISSSVRQQKGAPKGDSLPPI